MVNGTEGPAQHRLGASDAVGFRMAGLNLAAWSTWAVANLAGAALSGVAGNTCALGFPLPCMFAGLLVLQLKSHSRIRAALAAAALATVAALMFQRLSPGP